MCPSSPSPCRLYHGRGRRINIALGQGCKCVVFKSLRVARIPADFPHYDSCYSTGQETNVRFCQLPRKCILIIHSATRGMTTHWVWGQTMTEDWRRIPLIIYLYQFMCFTSSNERVMLWRFSLQVSMSTVLKLSSYFPFWCHLKWKWPQVPLEKDHMRFTIYPFHDVARYFFNLIISFLQSVGPRSEQIS